MEKERLVIISEKELNDLIYFTSLRATERALDRHFRGLLPFLNRINDDNEKIIEQLDFIKLSDSQNEPEKAVEEVEKPLKKKSEVTIKNPAANPKLARLIEEMSLEDKDKMAKAMKEAIENNRLINKVNPIRVPEFKENTND
jgi:hypothetical protein